MQIFCEAANFCEDNLKKEQRAGIREAQKNLEEYISQLRVETERQKAEIEQRFAESLRYLQTGKK
ncbi:hypothetical protein J4221_03380 [Candidatus Pacearchaeota archaeon]|nr:hypothetical protein [Candidatus Pacearchaeota archaeon]